MGGGFRPTASGGKPHARDGTKGGREIGSAPPPQRNMGEVRLAMGGHLGYWG